ncbi:MAG: DUF3014 domain-containing protein [Sulfurifustis sp.]
METEKQQKRVWPVVVALVLVAIAAGLYYWLKDQVNPPPPAETAAPTKTEPAIRHPIQRTDSEGQPLPVLAESDEALRDAGAGLIGMETLGRLFNANSIVRRVVVTIDNLPRQQVSQRYSLAKPVSGQLRVSGKGEALAMNADNYRRYAAYVHVAESIDAQKLVAAYIYFYPLFQEEYRNLGYPKKYFNDRVVEAIDDLLAAPDLQAPIKLEQPKVLYQYADSNLEALSAGQKIMIRIGPENAARVKAKLKEIRQALIGS